MEAAKMAGMISQAGRGTYFKYFVFLVAIPMRIQQGGGPQTSRLIDGGKERHSHGAAHCTPLINPLNTSSLQRSGGQEGPNKTKSSVSLSVS